MEQSIGNSLGIFDPNNQVARKELESNSFFFLNYFDGDTDANANDYHISDRPSKDDEQVVLDINYEKNYKYYQDSNNFAFPATHGKCLFRHGYQFGKHYSLILIGGTPESLTHYKSLNEASSDRRRHLNLGLLPICQFKLIKRSLLETYLKFKRASLIFAQRGGKLRKKLWAVKQNYRTAKYFYASSTSICSLTTYAQLNYNSNNSNVTATEAPKSNTSLSIPDEIISTPSNDRPNTTNATSNDDDRNIVRNFERNIHGPPLSETSNTNNVLQNLPSPPSVSNSDNVSIPPKPDHKSDQKDGKSKQRVSQKEIFNIYNRSISDPNLSLEDENGDDDDVDSRNSPFASNYTKSDLPPRKFGDKNETSVFNFEGINRGSSKYKPTEIIWESASSTRSPNLTPSLSYQSSNLPRSHSKPNLIIGSHSTRRRLAGNFVPKTVKNNVPTKFFPFDAPKMAEVVTAAVQQKYNSQIVHPSSPAISEFWTTTPANQLNSRDIVPPRLGIVHRSSLALFPESPLLTPEIQGELLKVTKPSKKGKTENVFSQIAAKSINLGGPRKYAQLQKPVRPKKSPLPGQLQFSKFDQKSTVKPPPAALKSLIDFSNSVLNIKRRSAGSTGFDSHRINLPKPKRTSVPIIDSQTSGSHAHDRVPKYFHRRFSSKAPPHHPAELIKSIPPTISLYPSNELIHPPIRSIANKSTVPLSEVGNENYDMDQESIKLLPYIDNTAPGSVQDELETQNSLAVTYGDDEHSNIKNRSDACITFRDSSNSSPVPERHHPGKRSLVDRIYDTLRSTCLFAKSPRSAKTVRDTSADLENGPLNFCNTTAHSETKSLLGDKPHSGRRRVRPPNYWQKHFYPTRRPPHSWMSFAKRFLPSFDEKRQKNLARRRQTLFEGRICSSIQDNVGYRLNKRKDLFEKRRKTSDICLIVALIGIFLMMLENEILYRSLSAKAVFVVVVMKILITIMTVILLLFILIYHNIELQLYRVENFIEDWKVAVTPKFCGVLVCELLLCAIHPFPTMPSIKHILNMRRNHHSNGGIISHVVTNSPGSSLPSHLPVNNNQDYADYINERDDAIGRQLFFKNYTIHPTIMAPIIDQSEIIIEQSQIEVILSVMMFARLYLIVRTLFLHSKMFSNTSSRSIGALNRIKFNAQFIFKTLMTMYPATVLVSLMVSWFFLASWILRTCERQHDPNNANIFNAFWLTSITFLAIGYGDLVPNTYCGRGISVCTGIMGAGCTALVVAVLAKKLELTKAERHVHNFMMDNQYTKGLKHAAANVLRETWLIYKYTKLTPKVNVGRVRKHQRKFLTAIRNLRQVKNEQQKLFENQASLVDIGKIQSTVHETVTDMSLKQAVMSKQFESFQTNMNKIYFELQRMNQNLPKT